MSQIFNIEDSEINEKLKIHIPDESLSIKHPSCNLKKKPLAKNESEIIKLKPVSLKIKTDKISSFNTKIKTQKHEKTSKSSLIEKSNFLNKKKNNLSTYSFLNIMNLVRMFIEILKSRINRKKYMNLTINHLNIINDKAYDKDCMRFEQTKIRFRIKNLQNQFFNFFKYLNWKLNSITPTFSVNNKVIMFWEIIIFCMNVFLLVFTPIEVSFNVDINLFLFGEGEVFDLLPIFMMIIDIFIKFNKGYYENGVEVLKKSKIIDHYVKKYLIYDTLAFLSIIYHFYDHDSVIKLLILSKYFSINEFIAMIEEKINLIEIYNNFLQIIKLLLNIIYVAHIIACIFHGISYYGDIKKNWVITLNLTDEPFYIRYIYSLHWSIETLATVGYGDIIPQNVYETLFCCFVMIIGCGVFAYSINSFGYIFTEMMKKKNENNTEMKLLNSMMKRKNLNFDLQNKIRNFFQSISDEEDKEIISKEDNLFQKLTKDLQKEIILNSNANILKKCKLFCRIFSEEFLQSICFKMKHQSFAPNELLFEENQENNISIFFITKGKISFFKRNNNLQENDEILLYESEKDEILGEFNLINDCKYEFNAKSIGMTTAYTISREDFIKVLSKFPMDKEKFFGLKDQIKFNNNLQMIENKCHLCKNSYHLTNDCIFIKPIFDKNKIIFNYINSLKRKQIKRKIFNRKINKKSFFYIPTNHIDNETLNTFININSENLRKSINYCDNTKRSNSYFNDTKEKSNEELDILKKEQTVEELEESLKNIEFESNLFPRGLSTRSNNQNKDKKKEKIQIYDFDFDKFHNFKHYFTLNNYNFVLKKFNNNKIPSIILNNEIQSGKTNKSLKKNIFKNFDDNSLKAQIIHSKKNLN